jgi:Eco29kI restriction endonuclease
MSNSPAFNPLDKHNLGESVGLALSRCPVVPLAEIPSFSGAGIYALYYSGDFKPYEVLAALNRPNPSVPIYVGKALPEGSRKGVNPKASHDSKKLRARLREHKLSIEHTAALNVKDFVCRFLVVEETWIGLCESLLIQTSTPLWNTMLDGFGRHVQGGNRKDGVSAWHAFHGGRDLNKGAKVSDELIHKLSADVAAFMANLKA